jgi:hypothetical protein
LWTKTLNRTPWNKTSWNFCGSMKLLLGLLEAADPTLWGDLSVIPQSHLPRFISLGLTMLPAVWNKADVKMSTPCTPKTLHQPLFMVRFNHQPGANGAQTRWSRAPNGRPSACADRVRMITQTTLLPDLRPGAKKSHRVSLRLKPS